MRLLFTVFACLCTFLGYIPSVLAQNERAGIVHFIFYPEDGAGDVVVNQQGGTQLAASCPYTGDDDCRARLNNQNYVLARPGQANCACVCQRPQQGCNANEQWNQNTCACEAPICNIQCPNDAVLNNNNNACTCDCNNQNQIFVRDPATNSGTCVCPPNPNGFVDGANILFNGQQTGWQYALDTDTCTWQCTDGNDTKTLTVDANGNVTCVPQGCNNNDLYSENLNNIFDCCQGGTLYDRDEDGTNNNCCPSSYHVYNSNSNPILDSCCPHSLVNNACPCNDGKGGTFRYVTDNQFFKDELIEQAQRDCACPMYTYKGRNWQLTEVDRGNGVKTCTLECSEEQHNPGYKDFNQGILSGTGAIDSSNNTFHCRCADDRNFREWSIDGESGYYTELGEEGSMKEGSDYCACADGTIRYTDPSSGYVHCNECKSYNSDHTLFDYVINYYGIDEKSIGNGDETIHCPSDNDYFAYQNSKIQVLGFDGKACPPHAAMTNAGGKNRNPTCSYVSTNHPESRDITYCYTGTLPENTVNNAGDGFLQRCEDLGFTDPPDEENINNLPYYYTALWYAVLKHFAIETDFNGGEIFIIPTGNVQKILNAATNGYNFNSATDVREVKVMYYGLYSCPFGTQNGNGCTISCRAEGTTPRYINGTKVCVCEAGTIPQDPKSAGGKDSKGKPLYHAGGCKEFSHYRMISPENCLWKGCKGYLTKDTNGKQACKSSSYLCSSASLQRYKSYIEPGDENATDCNGDNKNIGVKNEDNRNLCNALTGTSGSISVSLASSLSSSQRKQFTNTAESFGVCPKIGNATSAYYRDNELRGGDLDQELLRGTISASKYIEDFFVRACSTVTKSLPTCTEGASIYSINEKIDEETKEKTKEIFQLCNCPSVVIDGTPTGEERCCGYGQRLVNGVCKSCPAQSYATSYNGDCVSCNILKREYLNLKYTGKGGETTCEICEGNSFPLPYTGGCHTCGNNQIPQYINKETQKECNQASENCEWQCSRCASGKTVSYVADEDGNTSYVDSNGETKNCDPDNPSDECTWKCIQSQS